MLKQGGNYHGAVLANSKNITSEVYDVPVIP